MPVDRKPIRKEKRKYHHKSRNGCSQCKQRHIKCDEEKPRCDNCSQAKRACSFMGMKPDLPSPSSQGLPALRSTRISSPITPVLPSFNFTKLSQTPELSLMDLAMLHNFSTQTMRTLGAHPEIHQVWATSMVQIGFDHRFLLHGLLSLSALHVAYTGSEDARQLIDYASHHQTIALRLYQLAIANPTEDQYDAVFALSIVILILAIATTGDEYGEAGMFDCKWIRLARGIRDVNENRFNKIKEGPLSLLIYEDEFKNATSKQMQSILSEKGRDYLPEDLKRLERLWQGEESLPGLTATEGNTYDEVFVCLRHTYSAVLSQDDEFMSNENSPSGIKRAHTRDRLIAEVFFWIYHVPTRYIELLEQRHPIALILFAHYAALFGEVCQAWFSDRSSRAMVTRIWTYLDENLRKWIKGPMSAFRSDKKEHA